ncbi:hypothetical protein D3C87_1607450 [compost metagenome]
MVEILITENARIFVVREEAARDTFSAWDARHVIQNGINVNIHAHVFTTLNHVDKFGFIAAARFNFIRDDLIALPPRVALPNDMLMGR